MAEMFLALALVPATGALFSAYMLWRNSFVYRYRTRLLDDGGLSFEERFRRHGCLPSYDTMLWQVTRVTWDDYWQED